MLLLTLVLEIYCVKEVEQNPLPKSQTKPFYIGTKEAPSEVGLLRSLDQFKGMLSLSKTGVAN